MNRQQIEFEESAFRLFLKKQVRYRSTKLFKKDCGWQDFKTECAGEKGRSIARRSANAAMLEKNGLPGLLLFKKKVRSLCSATKMEKILECGLLNGLLNPVEKKIAACGRQVGAQKSVPFAVAHKKLVQLVPFLFVGFYLRSKCCKFQRKWVTRALT